MTEAILTAAQVAKIAGCHRNTVANYSNKGLLVAFRDSNGYRRYSLEQALKLREILSQRTPDRVSAYES